MKIFNRIRQRLLNQNHFKKYFLYAIGEIFLVVIGILIALSINNWNENIKSKKIALEIYQNLHTALKQDSIEVRRILKLNTESLLVQERLILSEANQEILEFDQDNLEQLILDIYKGVYTFFPKQGIYNSILSSNGMDLFESEQLKTSLINLYDHQYKRYQLIDATVEKKYDSHLLPVILKKIEYVPDLSMKVNPELFKKHYAELVSECRNVYDPLMSNKRLLLNISKEINELLVLIRIELGK